MPPVGTIRFRSARVPSDRQPRDHTTARNRFSHALMNPW